MDALNHIATSPRAADSGRSEPNPAAPETDIDLDRIVYDPAYRRAVRDQLNHARKRAAERS